MTIMSNFSNGFASGISIRGVPVTMTHPGKVFWVGNSGAGVGLLVGEKGASNGNKGTFLEPFATIDYAVGNCVANRGDIIFVRPGHTETVSAADGLVFDVAGIAVIGLGTGSNRPTINFTTATTADCDVSAANVTLVNLLFTGGFDNITVMLNVTASDFKMIDCEYRDVTGQVAIFLSLGASADRCIIDGLRYVGDSATGTTQAMRLTGVDNGIIRNFDITGNFSTSAINFATTAATNVQIYNGYIWNQRDAANPVCIIDTVTGSTGRVGPNIYCRVGVDATTDTTSITEAIQGATFHYFGGGTVAGLVSDAIQVVNASGESSMTWNNTASTDA